ncbi:oxysterol binding protein-like 3a isoform X1, partial [Silurus meridionalis]
RYFLLERGILMYGKTLADLKKGKVRGCIDIGLSVMSIKKKNMCIDLDAEDSIYHLKVKSLDQFDKWVSQLRNHRIFRQNEIVMDSQEHHLHSDTSSLRRVPTSFDRIITFIFNFLCPSLQQAVLSKQSSALFKNSWLQSSEDMKKCCRDLSECESSLLELNLLLKNMQVLHRTFSAPAVTTLQVVKERKKGRRRWRSKHYRKNSKNTSLVSGSTTSAHLYLSNPNLTYSQPELDTPDSLIDASQLQEDFCKLAGTVCATLKSTYSSLCTERDRVRCTLELNSCPNMVCDCSCVCVFLCITVTIKCCLVFTHSHSRDMSDGPQCILQQVSNEMRGSIPESLSEFFDAKEYLVSSSSSEVRGWQNNDSCLSDVSDNESVELCSNDAGIIKHNTDGSLVHRRLRLPSACVSGGVNLWSILSANIGKDLSKVAMPVQLNEPVNTLQRLCEEMEYCHLLDTAAQTQDPHMRMVYIAAFAVSMYACTFTRAGKKPFNPVLGETYECEHPDKGFRFISEQVSHHPPVSACHCESKNFTLWQDVRWRNKFWGKSMEIVPMGTTHIVLPCFGDHYEMNRVTSCIHNILSGQRWIEHYGEMTIKNNATAEDTIICKVTFLKSKARSLNTNDVEAVVTDSEGHVIHSLFGKWNEALYLGDPPLAICIWRTNPMPEDYEQYYGFTQFTVELNELNESMKSFLPPTDTRFRPDQRLLEEGDIAGAEEQKERIESVQRERRRILQESNMTHTPRFFKYLCQKNIHFFFCIRWSEDDSWISNGTYWQLREDPGFRNLEFPVLW